MLLAGDIVDKDNRYYETIGILETGIRKLEEVGIQVIGVAGNHDYKTLAAIADEVSNFTLIGRKGAWETLTLKKKDREALQVCGWSFPQEHIRENPLRDFPLERSQHLPLIGLMHCDLYSSESSYAPVSIADLKSKEVTAWILGHIHDPRELESQPPILYSGSPQGLDPSERGEHGARLLVLDTSGNVTHTLIPLSGLRWETAEISADHIQDEDDFRKLVNEELIHLSNRLDLSENSPIAVGYRLRLTGRTRACRQLDDWAALAGNEMQREIEGIHYFYEKIINETKPDLNLEDIAKTKDPPGLLAKKLITLETKEPVDTYRELISSAEASLNDVYHNPSYQVDEPGQTATEEEVRKLLIQSGTYALEQLIAQQGEEI